MKKTKKKKNLDRFTIADYLTQEQRRQLEKLAIKAGVK